MRRAYFLRLMVVLTILFPSYLYAITLEEPLKKECVRKEDYKKKFEQLSEIALNCYYSQKFDTAIAYFSFVFQQYRPDLSNEDKLYCAKAANGIGASCSKTQDYFIALSMYWKAIDICNEIGEEDYKMFIFNNIAVLYGRFNVNAKASPIFKELFNYLYNNQQYEMAGEVINNILLCAIELNDTASIKWCRDFSQNSQLKGISPALYCHYIASSFYNRHLGEIDSTIYYAKKAISCITSRMGKDERLMDCNQYIGEAFYIHQKYDSAIYYLKISNLMAKKLDVKIVLKSNYKTLLTIFQKLKCENEANKLSKEYIIISDAAFEEQEHLRIKQLEYSIERNQQEGEIIRLQKEKTHKEVIISVQKKWIVSIAAISVIILALLFMIYHQNKKIVHNSQLLYQKNKELTNKEDANTKKRREMQAIIDEQEKEIELLSANISIETKRYNNSSLNLKQKLLLTNEIRNILEKSEQFLSPDFSLEKFAKKLKSNTTYVSQIVNEEFGKNFTTLINELRIKKACVYLEDPTFKNYTIEAIAQTVGFKNRATFNSSFKKYIGITPSDYLKISSKS